MGTASSSVNYLRNFLPQDLPNARILSWSYDADMQSSFCMAYIWATSLDLSLGYHGAANYCEEYERLGICPHEVPDLEIDS
jgi:hypothetical protein